MNASRTLIVTVATVLIALLGLCAYAFARSDGVGPAWWRGAAGWHDCERGGWHDPQADPERIRELRADLAADVAADLDASPEEVESAFRAVVAQRLEDAAADGRIDREAVGDALAAYDAGDVADLFEIFKRNRGEATEPS